LIEMIAPVENHTHESGTLRVAVLAWVAFAFVSIVLVGSVALAAMVYLTPDPCAWTGHRAPSYQCGAGRE
jgi:hypothetical protein